MLRTQIGRRLEPGTGTNLLNDLKNAYLAFEALTDHSFEYRCWLWGNDPQIVTYDACMKLSTNFVTRQQTDASRASMEIDVDLITLFIQLSILSHIVFKGVRMQFVVGAGETIGSSPAWIAPGNRLSEFFRKSARGLQQGSTPSEIRAQDGNGTALVEHLQDKSQGIGVLGRYSLCHLNGLFRKCFDEGISK